MTTFDHAHGYVRMRRLPALVIWVALKLGLHRFVVVSGSLPHHPDCTPTVAVTEGELA